MNYFKIFIFTLLLQIPVYSQAIQNKLVLKAKEMNLDQKTGLMVLEDQVQVFEKKTNSWKLFTDQLKLEKNLKTDEISYATATNNVIVKKENFELKTNALSFDSTSNQILAKGNVVITEKFTTLKSDRLIHEIDPELTTLFSIQEKNVEIRYNATKATNQQTLDKNNSQNYNLQNFSATARKIILFKPQEKITLSGNVKIIENIDNSEIFAEKVDLFFDNNQELKHIFAKGNFYMKQKNRESTAEEAIFEVNQKTVTLLYDARVTEKGTATISADFIEMFFEVSKGIIRGNEKKPIKIEIPYP